MINKQDFMDYINNGWPVIPIRFQETDGKVDKKPGISSWREFQSKMPTEADVDLWLSQGQYDGLALITGELSKIVVVDVDSKDCTVPLDSPIIVNSPFSGGKHFYYRWSGELKNAVRVEGTPIDFRGDNGLILLPPSSYKGKAYTFEKREPDFLLDEVPQNIKTMLKAKKERPWISLTNNDFPKPEPGERNNTAASVAGTIIRSITTDSQRELIGWPRFQQWNSQLPQPLPERELRTTWDSIMLSQGREEEIMQTVRIYKGSEAVARHAQIQASYGAGLTTGITEMDEYFTFIPTQMYLLSAATHQGKTTLALNIAARAALSGHRVMFASLEQGLFIVPRITDIAGGVYPENLYLLDSEESISSQTLISSIEGMADKPELLIIDHLHFIDKPEKMGATQAIDMMMVKLQNMIKRLKLPLLLIAHLRKLNDDKPPTLDDLRDSSSLSQIPRVVMQIYRSRAKDKDMYQSYTQKSGQLFIQKNSVTGKTGVMDFTLSDQGVFEFNKTAQANVIMPDF